METNNPFRIGGNVLNNGLISNLPDNCVVEVPCLVDRKGVQGCYVGDLPEQCAALNRTNVNVQNLTIEAALTGKREHIYHAAMLDPHTAAELNIDQICNMCDDLIEAHGEMLPEFC
jgi:alpha-galactosidase